MAYATRPGGPRPLAHVQLSHHRPKWGERPRAIVVPSKRAAFDAATLRAHLSVFVEGGISRYTVAEELVFVDSLDETCAGELLRRRFTGAWR